VPRVAQAEVQPLTCDRMQRLSGIADVHLVAARTHAAHLQRGYLHAAELDARDAPGARWRDACEFGDELGLGRPDEALGARALKAPYESVAPGKRQEGKRPGRREALIGSVERRRVGVEERNQ